MDIKEIIFKAYKDKALIAKTFKNDIVRDYNLSYEDARNIFIRINNYQVKKYGRKLDKEDPTIYSKQELLRISFNARCRNNSKKNYIRKGDIKNGQ